MWNLFEKYLRNIWEMWDALKLMIGWWFLLSWAEQSQFPMEIEISFSLDHRTQPTSQSDQQAPGLFLFLMTERQEKV